MSILLNAINKSKQAEQDDAQSLEAMIVSNEISEESSADGDELQRSGSAVSAQQMFLLTLALVVIAGSLLVIATLMVLDRLAPVASSALTPAATTEITTKSESLEPDATRLNGASQSLTQEPSKEEQGQLSSSRSAEGNIKDASDEPSGTFLESYQPQEVTPKVVTSTVTERPVSTESSSSESPVEASSIDSGNLTPNDESLASLARQAQDARIMSLDELADVDLKSTQLVRIDAHVYAEQESKSFVFINGALQQTGDQLEDGWLLERIEPEAIIISKAGLRVRKPVNN